MTRHAFPTGYRAVHDGELYRANGGLRGQVTLRDEHGAEVRTVPIGELAEWYSVRTVGTYLDEPFLVEAEVDGSYAITYVGGNGAKIADEWAARKGAADGSRYWQEDRYTFMATVPKADVHDVREERKDELGPWRAAQEKR